MSGSVSSSQSPRLTEALYDYCRTSVPLASGTSDDPTMTAGFAHEMYVRAFCMESLGWRLTYEPQEGVGDLDVHDDDSTEILLGEAYGQAGYVRLKQTADENGLVRSVCVSAKHNLSIHSKPSPTGNEVEWFLPDEPQKIVGSKSYKHHVRFPENAFRCKKEMGDTKYFGFGLDITVSLKTPRRLLPYTFEMIRDDFEIRVGLKIGIAIYRNFEVSPLNAGEAVTQDQFSRAFGDGSLKKAIFTGVITACYDDHFQHTINTFQGCSGAIVFLLENQDNPQDVGKAIGVHTNSTTLGNNYAFFLTRDLLTGMDVDY